MPAINCPSQDLDEAFAATLLKALDMHDSAVHAVPVQAPPQKLKLDAPTIAAGCDPDQWSAFIRQWVMYKVGMGISAKVLPTALFYCCDNDLRTDIMTDTRSDMAEKDLLSAIKRLAVKDESTLVHRIRLSKMTQAPGTVIHTY